MLVSDERGRSRMHRTIDFRVSSRPRTHKGHRQRKTKTPRLPWLFSNATLISVHPCRHSYSVCLQHPDHVVMRTVSYNICTNDEPVDSEQLRYRRHSECVAWCSLSPSKLLASGSTLSWFHASCSCFGG